ncbi:cytochrome P450, partial [Streptomyces scabiei]|nr:cytochrome P450 [Streptomyces scabiei]
MTTSAHLPPALVREAVQEPMPLDDVNLADLDNFTDGVTPWRMFHTLRHEDPVHWQPEEAPNSG